MIQKIMEEKEEFEEIETRLVSYRPDLQRFIFTMTKDKDANEEILQNTIATAYVNLTKLRNPDVLKNWMFNIAKTETSHYFRRNPVGFRSGVDVITDFIEIEGSDVLDDIIEQEFQNETWEMVDRLEPKYAKVLILHYYHGIDFKRIAEICNMNYGTVRTNHRRGLEKLKNLYESRKNR